MKKLLAMMLALLMVMSLAACGGNTEPTVPTTEAPTEPPVPATNMSYFSLSMGQDSENVVYLSAYTNEDGTVTIEYFGDIRKTGTLSAEAMGKIAQAYEASVLPTLNGLDEYNDGEANASMYVCYTNEDGDEIGRAHV